MKISELVEKLNEIKDASGDLEVISSWVSGGYGYPNSAKIVVNPMLDTAFTFDSANVCQVKWNKESKEIVVLRLT